MGAEPDVPSQVAVPRVAAVAAFVAVAGGLAIGAASALPLLALSLSVVVAAVALWAPPSFRRPLFFFVVAPWLLVLGLTWPLAGAVALVAVLPRASVLLRRARPRPSWVAGRRVVLAGSAVGLLAAPVAATLAKPQLQETGLTVPFAAPSPVVVTVLIIVAAALNALVEELLWRGQVMSMLKRAGVPTPALVLTQAVSFGLAHLSGLPGGSAGVLGASGLAVILGALRVSRAGLLSAILAHFIVDYMLFSAAAKYVMWTG